jgi:hypothetical protein
MLVRYPARHVCAVVVCRARDGGWLAIARGHAWLCGSIDEARAEACWLSANLNLPILEHWS